jgi:hypothetical protein
MASSVPKKLSANFSSLSDNIIIMILQNIIEEADDDSNTSITNFITIPQFRLIIAGMNAKEEISACRLSLLSTRAWILALFSMGYDYDTNQFSNNDKFSLTWGKKIIDIQKKIITEKL